MVFSGRGRLHSDRRSADAAIISETTEAPAAKYEVARDLAEGVLSEGLHYDVDRKGRAVTLNENGYAEAEGALGRPLFDAKDPWAPFLLSAFTGQGIARKGSRLPHRRSATGQTRRRLQRRVLKAEGTRTGSSRPSKPKKGSLLEPDETISASHVPVPLPDRTHKTRGHDGHGSKRCQRAE